MIINSMHLLLKMPLIRHYFRRKISFKTEKLLNRSIISVSGIDTCSYLQGLITNDINLLTENKDALFSFVLNTKGRILYDILIYKKSENDLLLECDSLCKADLLNHLKLYRVRKKVNFELLNNKVWVTFAFDDVEFSNVRNPEYVRQCQELLEILSKKNCLSFEDPRSSVLGFRTLSASETDVSTILSSKGIHPAELDEFKKHRFTYGIAEGVQELPSGNCFPLESNGDYLHGISFNKGCYIGQELTARSHHTGVIRKRIMPLVLASTLIHEDKEELPVISKEGKTIGKLRGLCGDRGVGLLRVSEALQSREQLTIGGVLAKTYEPFWWLKLH